MQPMSSIRGVARTQSSGLPDEDDIVRDRPSVAGGRFLDNQRLCLARADREGFEVRRTEAAARGRLRGFGFANYIEANGGLQVADAIAPGDLPHRVRRREVSSTDGTGRPSLSGRRRSPARTMRRTDCASMLPRAGGPCARGESLLREGDSDASARSGGGGNRRLEMRR